MPENQNAHVERLARYLPFDPSHDQIYEEYQLSGDSLNLDTVACSYVLESAKSGAQVIVLTGDAGHGKTHLCRRILQEYLHFSEEAARDLINTKCDGRHVIEVAEGNPDTKPLRVFKDFSEFAPEVAAELIENARDEKVVTIICANEGRLRAVLSSSGAGELCSKLLQRFEASFDDGRASGDGLIHIVNLNHQSIAAGDAGSSLADRALREWTSGTRWRVCGECDSRAECPVLRNREMLSERTDEVASSRKAKLRLLLATLERIGYVITIRDMLMTFSYLLTGGLKCRDVHRMRRRNKKGWQQAYAFYNLAFAAPDTLSKEQLRRLPLMDQLPKLDPGKRAIREVDERIVNEQGIFERGQVDLAFPAPTDSDSDLIDAADGIDEITGDPRSRKQRSDESTNVTRVVRTLRRRAFVDGLSDSRFDMAHLGFPYGLEFLQVVEDELDVPARTKLKRRVISGLHHLQGLQFTESTPTLHLVDPAFGRSMSGTAILAARVNPSKVDLVPLSKKWGDQYDAAYHIRNSVDWIDRHIVLRIEDQSGTLRDLHLDLMTFDCILRASSGHVPTKFYEHDIRRVGSFLGRIAQSGAGPTDQIDVVKDGRVATISIDRSTVQVGTGT